jgi:hypothetical protein
MTAKSFLTYIRFSRDCPDYMNLARWAGMLVWFKTRQAADDLEASLRDIADTD